jgi:hypothetical protein
MVAKQARETGHAVRVSTESFENLVKVREVVASRGWRAIGVESTRPPTLSAVVEQAIVLLLDQVAEEEDGAR